MNAILITGAAGFIGSHTVERLLAASDSQIIAIDDLSTGHLSNLRAPLHHSRFRMQEGDIREPGLLDTLCDLHRPNTIIHLAGLVSVSRAEQEPSLNFDLNLNCTQLVAEAARKNGVGRIVFASSAACYGESEDLPLSEDQAVTPISMYGTAKLASEKLLAGYSHSYGIDTVCLRYFNVFGERQDPNSPYSGVISRFADAFAAGAPATLFGNGTQTRDFVSVHDVARANSIAATASYLSSGVRNVCTGQRRSLLDVLGTFQALTPDAPAARFACSRPGDIHDSCGDPHRARQDLGFSATVSLEEGLRKLILSNLKSLASA
jgi:UDP-glucose 4-epimerase